MPVRKIIKGIYSVGSINWDARLFDGLIPLPHGTSYNSYLIQGSEKVALIDTVDHTKIHELVNNLRALNVTHIDYVIALHSEQDHSGSLPEILNLYPQAKVVTNPKCKDLLKEMLLISDEKFIEVKDKETLSLGDKTLEFIHAPWVHWPDSMFAYLKEEQILFSTDFLGSHLATSNLFATGPNNSVSECVLYEGAKRYYAEIMMPFRTNIKKHLETLKSYQIGMIAPAHGPIYNKPDFIINAYTEWISDKVKNYVIIPYVSMHGSTERMVEYLTDGLIERDINVTPFNLTKTDIGELAISLVDAATLVVGTSTVLVGPHPNVVSAVYLANALRPKLKFASIIGSYGWGTKMVETITGLMTNIKAEIIEPVIIKGYPKEVDFKSLDRLADSIAEKHKTLF